MPTFIKPGFWEKRQKGYANWLNLDQFLEYKPTSTYKVYSALLNQSTVNQYSGNLILGNKYLINELIKGIPVTFSNLIGGSNYLSSTYSMNGTGDGQLKVDLKTVGGVITEISNGLLTGLFYSALDTFVLTSFAYGNDHLIRIDTVDESGIPLTFTILNGGTNNYVYCSDSLNIEWDTLLGVFQSVTLFPGTYKNFEVGDVITINGGSYNGSFEIASVNSDNFSNLGYVSNGTVFTATGNIPTTWLNGTIVIDATESAPIPTIMENTIGDIVWTYVSNGDYTATLSDAFTNNKTLLFYEKGEDVNGNTIRFFKISESVYRVLTVSANDNVFDNSSIEIRVYN